MLLTALLFGFAPVVASPVHRASVPALGHRASVPALGHPARVLAVEDKPLSFPEAKARFESLHKAGDRAGCVALWRANPHYVLRVIDADLEGSLRLRETSKEPDAARLQELHVRALWGAGAAVEATGHPIFADYAAAFVGWNEVQRGQFRAGQGLYKKAIDAFNAGEHEAARTAGRECVERAAPLGDWWGMAMGLEAQAMAHQAQGSLEDALSYYSQARLLNHDLGLFGDEYGDVRSMIDLCYALERWSRGREAVEQALELGRKIGDVASQAELYERRATFEEKLGDKAAAAKSRAQGKAAKKE